MSSSKESTPLLSPSNASGTNSSKYYFLNQAPSESMNNNTGDGGEVIETVPQGASEDEFAPRILSRQTRHPSQKGPSMSGTSNNGLSSARRTNTGSIFGWLFGSNRGMQNQSSRSIGNEGVGTLPKLRKAPIKIEPKVFFANERTFLAWMHLSVILAGASIAILAFAAEDNPFSQLYGVVLLPVAISFIVYSMYQYKRRAAMIRHRHPGPYEDTTGPVVLGIMLMISIVAQFAMKMYSLATSQ